MTRDDDGFCSVVETVCEPFLTNSTRLSVASVFRDEAMLIPA